MSKYCPLADAVTNCTDNCKSCLEEEKLYTLYSWRTDDEGGYGVCKKDKFSYKVGYRPETGPWARPSIWVGDFNTFEELTELISKEYGISRTEALEEAKWFMDALLEKEE